MYFQPAHMELCSDQEAKANPFVSESFTQETFPKLAKLPIASPRFYMKTTFFVKAN